MDAVKLWQYDCYNVWSDFESKQKEGDREYWLHIWLWTWGPEGKSAVISAMAKKLQ